MTSRRYTVTEEDTALALGSGDVPVLATPRLLAWFEQATVAAAAPGLEPGATSVGVEVQLQHQRPCAVGAVVEVEVRQVPAAGRRLTFSLIAREETAGGDLREIARGQVLRAVVDRDRFLRRLGAQGAPDSGSAIS